MREAIPEELLQQRTGRLMTCTYPLTTDNQPGVLIQVSEGECVRTTGQQSLEQDLDGIPSAPSGASVIEVAFDIDAKEVLNASAQDKTTGKPNQFTFTNEDGRLSQTEINRVVQEAEEYQNEDEANTAAAHEAISQQPHTSQQQQTVQREREGRREGGDRLRKGRKRNKRRKRKILETKKKE